MFSINWRQVFEGTIALFHLIFPFYLYLLNISIWISLFYWIDRKFNLNMSNNLSESFIKNLFKEEKLPDSWDYNYNLTYLALINCSSI